MCARGTARRTPWGAVALPAAEAKTKEEPAEPAEEKATEEDDYSATEDEVSNTS